MHNESDIEKRVSHRNQFIPWLHLKISFHNSAPFVEKGQQEHKNGLKVEFGGISLLQAHSAS